MTAATLSRGPTMALVIAVIALVAGGYHVIIARFPNEGGDAKGLAVGMILVFNMRRLIR